MPGIHATRAYNPGDLIYREEGFVQVLRRGKKDEQCEFCFKESEDLIPCYKCSAVKYCGQECQTNHSSEHERECPNMHHIDECPRDNFVRMVSRIIFKLKDKDWKAVTRNVLGKNISFEDVDSHYEEMTKNPRLVLLCKELAKSIKSFVGEENMPREEELIKIIGKVKFSSPASPSDEPELFCFGTELFEHKCIPNANMEICNKVLKVWAIKKIRPSEKISVSHRNIMSHLLPRSPVNLDSLDVCKCTECSLPYGESVLTKILDQSKAYTVIRMTEKVLNMADVLTDFDLENNDTFRRLVDHTLQNHVGVLGLSNALHMKLLAIKAMSLESSDVQKKMYLIELEKIMSKTFGEYYYELNRLYKALVVASFKVDNVPEAAFYFQKEKKTRIPESDEALPTVE